MSTLKDLRFGDLLESLAAKTPVPGGGAVAAMAGATACALASMVVHYSQGKADLAAFRAELDAADAELASRRGAFLDLADQDAAAFAAYGAATKLAKDDPARGAAVAAAVARCVAAPMGALEQTLGLAVLLDALKGKINKHLRSDWAIAAVMADAAARSCRCNVEINLPQMADGGERARTKAEMERMLVEVGGLVRGVLGVCGGA